MFFWLAVPDLFFIFWFFLNSKDIQYGNNYPIATAELLVNKCSNQMLCNGWIQTGVF